MVSEAVNASGFCLNFGDTVSDEAQRGGSL